MTKVEGAHPQGPPVPWELGSEFHWDDGVLQPAGAGTSGWLPRDSTLFASGTGALRALLAGLGRRTRLHLPSFFCMPVAAALAPHADLRWYRHLPGQGPDLAGLSARAGDVVLAVNLFGHERGDEWAAWSGRHPHVTLVEDHTHDPLSEWCLTSGASFCVASLRKTLPLPDGALLWSPAGRDVPSPHPGPDEGAGLKHAAMVLKAAWLSGRGVSKDTFRALSAQGERLLVGSMASPLALTRAVLPLVDARGLRRCRVANASTLLAGVGGGGRRWAPLFDPSAPSPFHVPLVCETEAVREELREHLRRHRIYAPVHWPQPDAGVSSGDAGACGLAGRVLTLPTDHRYGPEDMQRVADTLRAFDRAARRV